MKRFIFILVTIGSIIMTSCSETGYLLYNDIDRVQMEDTVTVNYTFVYEPESVIRDTVYIQVNTIGNIANYDREIELKQIPEYNYTYVRDPETGQVTDTIETERPNKAVAGVDYVALDDAELKKFYVVKANAVTAQIPVVLLRDANLKNESYRLRLELVESKDFGLGESNARAKTIILSDFLQRFYSWRVDNSVATAYNLFGKYSIAKHQFMIDVSGEVIDEDWYQTIVAIQATSHYKNLFKEALNTFNNDPVNLASGKAPLRETDDSNSPLVTFP
ncbi:DUF4843 domain-containing protein [uncultured Bacteroides sp.]|uniref:DUF4843 domain-containing protein n=1 Tax=uncultured Bacteroides sp. TaxID=162156 RepID=UPI002AA7D50C|nr:DUF4843 domain-containing protein [uncultured Bacteroides sp.]